MVRKSSTILQEELYSPSEDRSRDEFDDSRVLDLDVEEESPFLRAQKRVPARKGTLPRKTATRLIWGMAFLCLLILCAVAMGALYHYGELSWRFRVQSSDDIEIAGLHNVTRAQVMDVMGGDIGRNIFFVPLSQRKFQLEQIPWVASASVMRFVPNRLRIQIQERVPVAFARLGTRILLVDASGTLMELPPKHKYSFPVILGMNVGEPPSTRLARMKLYGALLAQLDSGGAHYSQDISEVDLSDPDDVKVMANSPDGEVLVHLGSGNYLERYKIYVSHVQEWRQRFDQLESVDLRYDNQIVVNPDLNGAARQAPISPASARRAMAAGVKPAALTVHQYLPVSDQHAKPKRQNINVVPRRKTRPAASVKYHAKAPTVKKVTHREQHANKPRSAAAWRGPMKSNMTARKGVVNASSVTTEHISRYGKKPSPAILKGQGTQ